MKSFNRHLYSTSVPAIFEKKNLDSEKFPIPALPASFLWEFITDGRTPARAMTDEAMKTLIPFLEGPGIILELGAGGDYYRQYASEKQRYITSNLSAGCDLSLDMTNIDLPENSVDAIVSVFAIEHIFNFEAAFQEQHRVLKPKGRLLLIAPFLYYYHAAPDDFYRFSSSALNELLSSFSISLRQPLGGRWLLFSEFLHEKVVMGSKRSFWERLTLRCLALPFLACGLKDNDSNYAMGFAYFCEKK